MKKHLAVLFFLFFCINNVYGQSAVKPNWMKNGGWVNWTRVCEDGKGVTIPRDTDCSSQSSSVTDVNSPLGAIFYAGKIQRLYYDVSKAAFTNLEIIVTWYSPSGNYHCGQVIKRKPQEVKDFDKVSLNLRKCN